MGAFFDLHSLFYGICAVGNLVFLLGLGIFSLDRRFRRLEEWTPQVQMYLLILVAVLSAFELALLRGAFHGAPAVYQVFSTLGLFAAMAALYGHLAVSLCSQLLVDWVTPGNEASLDQPHYGPAEALERQGDYEGAAREYQVIARLFPKNPEVFRKFAECLVHGDKPEDALSWFERSLRLAEDPADALPVLWRLTEVLTDRLNRPDRAAWHMNYFMQRFPGTPEAQRVHQRMQCIAAPSKPVTPPGNRLLAMDTQPLEDPVFSAESPAKNRENRKNLSLLLDRMEETPLDNEEKK